MHFRKGSLQQVRSMCATNGWTPAPAGLMQTSFEALGATQFHQNKCFSGP